MRDGQRFQTCFAQASITKFLIGPIKKSTTCPDIQEPRLFHMIDGHADQNVARVFDPSRTKKAGKAKRGKEWRKERKSN